MTCLLPEKGSHRMHYLSISIRIILLCSGLEKDCSPIRNINSSFYFIAGFFIVGLVIGRGIHSILGISLGTFMISRPTLSSSH